MYLLNSSADVGQLVVKEHVRTEDVPFGVIVKVLAVLPQPATKVNLAVHNSSVHHRSVLAVLVVQLKTAVVEEVHDLLGLLKVEVVAELKSPRLTVALNEVPKDLYKLIFNAIRRLIR